MQLKVSIFKSSLLSNNIHTEGWRLYCQENNQISKFRLVSHWSVPIKPREKTKTGVESAHWPILLFIPSAIKAVIDIFNQFFTCVLLQVKVISKGLNIKGCHYCYIISGNEKEKLN
ncbi:hypothetical protein XENOCAPTIV_023423 [Xenoophorus captivus]|uniref:Uncharacterized protein n=1 Tax=Xenoophorus captivus TaxID=1517983 RepID=A0ABV0SEG3_9TELE